MSESWHPRKTEKDVAVARTGVAKYDRGWIYGAGTHEHDHSEPDKGGEVLNPEQILNTYYVSSESELIDVSNKGGNINIVATTDFSITTRIDFDSADFIRFNLDGYTITDQSGDTAGIMLRFMKNNQKIIVKNGTLDANGEAGSGIKAGVDPNYPDLLVVSNLEINNFTSWGMRAKLYNDSSEAPMTELNNLVVKDTKFDAGAQSPVNECIFCSTASMATVKGCTFVSNKK